MRGDSRQSLKYINRHKWGNELAFIFGKHFLFGWISLLQLFPQDLTTTLEFQMPVPGQCPKCCLQLVVNIVNKYKATCWEGNSIGRVNLYHCKFHRRTWESLKQVNYLYMDWFRYGAWLNREILGRWLWCCLKCNLLLQHPPSLEATLSPGYHSKTNRS